MNARRTMARFCAVAVLMIASAVFAVQPAQADTGRVCTVDIYFYSVRGARICNTTTASTNIDGVERMWIIGGDWAVWNIVKYANGTVNGWASLGGSVRNGVNLKWVSGPNNITITATGADNNPWCNTLNYDHWEGWWTGWPC